MVDNELLLSDRLHVIKDTINKYGEENFYMSFSVVKIARYYII